MEQILDLDTPMGLLQAFSFIMGIQGGQEQRNLKISQLSRETVVLDGKYFGQTRIIKVG